jgi:hypothetical protein
VAPPGVLNTLIEAGLLGGPVVFIAALAIRFRFWPAAEVRRLNGLDIEHIVLAHQGKRRFVVKVGSLPSHVLMLLGTPAHGFRAAVAALLASCDMPLRFGKLLLGLPIVARILHYIAVRRDEKHFQPYVDAGLASGEGQWLKRDVGTREADIPAIRLFADRDGLDGALDSGKIPRMPLIGPLS